MSQQPNSGSSGGSSAGRPASADFVPPVQPVKHSAPAEENPYRYTAQVANQIESAWQDAWARQGTFRTPNPGEPAFDPRRPKKFILDMFPYPSGVGLHVGHPLGYIATDIYARYLRMTGHNVLHAMGFDSFGLPAEQYAVQTNTHPRVTTERNIATMRAQLRRLGLGHDDRRSVSTTDPAYYRWTQWIFLQIYNSWYDPRVNAARPLSELVAALDSGSVRCQTPGPAWAKRDAAQKKAELDARRLAFLAEVPVNWCPRLGTVLANEEVTADGKSERGNFPVYKRPLKQWMMRITAYADRLAADLEGLDWPEPIKLLQRNWIGRSEGAYVDFAAGEGSIRVYTTRPDTLHGATYMVLSPEHPLVDALTTDAAKPTAFRQAIFPGAAENSAPRANVAAYRAFVKSKTDRQRQEAKDKTGVFTGAYAVNPVNGKRIPVFIADYVLMGYGTGAIMAVPAHDERDHDFAKAFGLPSCVVVAPTRPDPSEKWIVRAASLPTWDACLQNANWKVVGEDDDEGQSNRRGLMFNSYDDALAFATAGIAHGSATIAPDGAVVGSIFAEAGFCVAPDPRLYGLPTPEAKRAIIAQLEREKKGQGAVQYKLRDWLFSRQRYWGEPFPVVFDEQGFDHALPEEMLPVLLPELDNFQPEASDDAEAPVRTPLSRAAAWVNAELDLGRGPQRYTREQNTMPNWAGSCWYYLRYLDPENAARFCDPAVEKYWMKGATNDAPPGGPTHGGVDLYVGGVEHAVLHLLYARFWHKVLFDLGHVSTPEPFQRLFNQGYIQAAAFKDARGLYVEASQVVESTDASGKPVFTYQGQPVTREFGKMGKSLKNAVTPDDIARDFGTDTLRVYEMSMGPLEASKPWNTRDISGAYRFLQRVWRVLIDEDTSASRVHPDPNFTGEPAVRKALHKAIKQVRRDMERLAFNTAVSKLIEFNNALSALEPVPGSTPGTPIPRECARGLILMLAPLAPHIAEELWHRVILGKGPMDARAGSIAYEPFPEFDPALATDDEIEIAVQVLGKVKHRMMVPAGASAEQVEAIVRADATVIALLEGKAIKKAIVVPARLVNFVV